ncbi:MULTISPECIES: tRNA (adenosine(37)-N6)-threonylcarbamoyltransferase complex ATPase subunit type 1 TsaE [unclassified Caulobacter]|uniref:tRNA (adenosine(37)-N6)-threonylcarbamoyltransferase complex ATPase subunit type 1 TsaE n=1 Tax=unclassified Caulobacter TaxID=2648921 RepID=UPI000D3465A2|nr:MULTISPECIES: tRNA (adenosine(37)-N6)-threonylcarbamoyltransferase complex ATPase subunit type 1 TsaE [unclassified Caulobacter]PTS91094.1 tRNA (adenosine(37)-N6)-threonylcarbamoyltransferase complex ATPase subunit type 1 TsaE [Caulobacter sp. HMWF009]PTT07444.1 tRNA (adenosine(37)-N6)-threonylcarbamoyltransferase complex ATPase subunit type 1 TsaE [Caulobacter sp. HMWF025]
MTTLALADEAATQALGQALARHLKAGDALCLTGPLGAGKSTLARALIRALTTPDEEVPSPTFTLVQFYETAAFPLAHFDLYRLSDPDEAYEIGLDEALDGGVALIEWPQRLEGRLPLNRLDIDIALDGDARRVSVTPHGDFKGRTLEF